MKFETSADLGTIVQDQTATFRLISDILKIISLLMAAITIFTITYIDLVDKRRQIGIERAIFRQEYRLALGARLSQAAAAHQEESLASAAPGGCGG